MVLNETFFSGLGTQSPGKILRELECIPVCIINTVSKIGLERLFLIYNNMVLY